ncbi:MAG TPA: glycosyltransferase [Candidatus Acidoferrum sp.]|nr:glycosyltransferase [Candidatus Acidoferrum sp.]
MAVAASFRPRVCVDGKFFRLGQKKFYVKGLAYGPFAPNAAGQAFASPERTKADLAQIREAGANLVRIYEVPAKWFLDLAAENQLKVLVDIPWNKHLCFLDSREAQAGAREAVRRAVYGCARHPAVFAFSVANEIPPDVVRWSGARAIAEFIDDLVHVAKQVDPECLCTFANYPPTEYLRPQATDFACFNLYLHEPQPLRNYLARLQMLADSKPLLLGEFGMDSLREGEERQAETLAWQIEAAFRAGLAGAVVFSFTDDWWRNGRRVDDWQMGLTTSQRKPKPAFAAVQRMFRAAPQLRLPRYPKVSVVVASYNGERTLGACLDSLQWLNYPDYEVILVDDGSTDTTPKLALQHTGVRYFRHEKNLGLSTARNTGIAAATGEIIAFTDSDCRADEDWLYYLVGDLLSGEFAAIGGPNLLPPEDSVVASAVMVSPGGPAHVMLTDREAEHIPGCNMAFYKWALAQIGGFDPAFHQAGDDVDICWRLQQAGWKIGFSPAAFVWHYRRSTVRAYLRQQYGYGEAEAILVRKHPECFNSIGASLWRGRIYTASRFGVFIRAPIIYRGQFGSAGFQSLYSAEPGVTLMLCTRPEYHVLVTLPLLVLSVTLHHVLPVAITSLLVSAGVCVAAGAQAALPKQKTRWWSRPLVAMLFFLQPLVRGWARYRGRLLVRRGSLAPEQSLDSIALRDSRQALRHVQYWAETPVDRLAWAAAILNRLDREGWPNKADIGWSEYDVEVHDGRWCRLQLATVAEVYAGAPGCKQMLRCRLRARWALRTKAAFWSLCALDLLVCGFFRHAWPWIWLVLLTLPLFVWFIRRQQRNLQSMIAILLDGLAKEWKLEKVSLKSKV